VTGKASFTQPAEILKTKPLTSLAKQLLQSCSLHTTAAISKAPFSKQKDYLESL